MRCADADWRPVTSGVRFEHLYVHVPFCSRRCVYCDFSIAVRSPVPVADYVRAIDAEWAARHASSIFHLETLYLGGGTPSKLEGEGVTRLMEIVHRRASLAAGAEVTLEVNPEDVSARNVREWRAAGINRLSIGVQSFQDHVLSWMHRTHDALAAHRAIATAREGGVENLSVDLIFSLPSVVNRDWPRDLDAALALDLPHLSVYGLTVEPRTPLGRWVARSDLAEAPDETFESEFLLAHEALSAAGFDHYEVSNFGRARRHSRHNWAYWTRALYAGLGPSAHEFDGAQRRWNVSAFAEWSARALANGSCVDGAEQLDATQIEAEEIYLGLRTAQGVSKTERDEVRVSEWIDAGWAAPTSDATVKLTAMGWLRIDALAVGLTQGRSRY